MKAQTEIYEKQQGLCITRQKDKFLTCLARAQIVDKGAAVVTETLKNWLETAAKCLECYLCFI